MSTVSPRRVAPAPLAGAVRTVNRWGLLAGVTGFYGNVLLLVLFTTPADGPWSWTGPASDTTGIVSPLAMIPVAAALRTVCGGRRGLGAISSLAIVAMAGMAAVSMLFVLGGVSFAMSVDSSYVGLAFMFGWVFAAGLAGRTSGRLPRQISNCGAALGAAGLAGSVLLLAVPAPMPAYSLISDVAFGAKVLLGIPVALYPVWLIVLSYRLPGHLTDVVGSTSRPLEVV
jgi:hypothetical protein